MALLALGLLAASLAMAGCSRLADVTGSIGAPSTTLPATDAGLQQYNQQWGERYKSRPNDKKTAINYARGLRAGGQYVQAVAVMQGIALQNPNDMEVLGGYGKALADAGRLREAADVLTRAHTPEQPNWSVLSAQGSVADQLGDHAQAQSFYMSALKIMPREPGVLSNLGLSYALSRRLPEAEQALRQAVAQKTADRRVRQNLALVLALEGKFAEAEELSRMDLSPADAANNVTAIREMIAQSNTWRDIQRLDQAPSVSQPQNLSRAQPGVQAKAVQNPRSGPMPLLPQPPMSKLPQPQAMLPQTMPSQTYAQQASRPAAIGENGQGMQIVPY